MCVVCGVCVCVCVCGVCVVYVCVCVCMCGVCVCGVCVCVTQFPRYGLFLCFWLLGFLLCSSISVGCVCVCGVWDVCRCGCMGGDACMCVWGLGMWGGVGGWMGACVHACMCTCSVYICCLYSGHVAKWFKALEHTSDHLSRSNPSLTKTAICRVEGNPDFCRLQTCTLTLNLLSQEAHLAGDLACLQC